MGQAEILYEMDKRVHELIDVIKKLEEEDERLSKVWESAFSKGELSTLLGVSMDAVGKSIHKLLLNDEVLSLKNSIDKRKRRYMIKNDDIIQRMDNQRTNK